MKLPYLLFIFFCLFHTNTFSQEVSSEEKIDEKFIKISSDTTTNPAQKEIEYKKLLEESIKFGYNNGILKSGFKLMRYYGDLGQNDNVIKIGNRLKKQTANDESSRLLLARIYQLNGLAFGYLGMLNDSRKDFKAAINYAESLKDVNQKNYVLSLCYENYTLLFHSRHFKEFSKDSTLIYLDKSIEKAYLIEDGNNLISKDLKYDMIAFAYMRMAIHSLELVDENGYLELAEEYLDKALKINENYNILPRNEIMLFNQVSWLYMEKGEYSESISFAKRALNLEKKYNAPYHRVESFEFLASSYLELGEKDKSKEYLGKYTFLKDSIALSEKNSIDVPLTLKITEVSGSLKKSNKKNALIIAIASLSIIIALFIFWRRKNKKINEKYLALIKKIEAKKLYEDEKSEEGIIVINDEATSYLLDKLKNFEKNNIYLKKEVNLTWLATRFNTNTKYLSQTIKLKTEKNFRDYLNGLRINYITNKLFEDPKYREYKINYLAEECGYSSSQVFVIAFKKETDVTPSYFIKKVKKGTIS